MTEVRSNVEGLELYSDNYPFRLSLRIRNFEADSDFKKFVRSCENIIRKSVEYRLWVAYIKDVLQINTCMITNERMDEVTLDVHHHIPSLFLLLKALINEKIEREEVFSTFDIALQAIEVHFSNRIGYAVLLKSMHEKFHNGFLSIPIELIRGDYRWFLDNYTRYLDEEDLETIEYRMSINRGNCNWSRDEYPGLVSSAGG